MKAQTFIIWILFLLVQGWSELNAQPNLVPNPSFEIQDTCPPFQGRICYAIPWFQPVNPFNQSNVCTAGSTDYFHVCNSGLVGVPINFTGHQNARTGVAYAGFIAGIDSTSIGSNSNIREYLEVKLLDSLIQGNKYCVTFYVSHADTSNIAIASLGVYFSNDSLIDTNANYHFIPVVPQIVSSIGFLTDENNWIEISGIITASGGEKFVTIGNFHDGPGTSYVYLHSYTSSSMAKTAYYYIDDVSVIEMTDSSSACGNVGVEEQMEKHFQIYPNPAKEQLTITNLPRNIESVEIFNLFGEKVFFELNNKNLTSILIDISKLQQGIHFLQLRSNSKIYTEKFVILR